MASLVCLVLIAVGFFSVLPSYSHATEYSYTYVLLDSVSGSVCYQLTVGMTSSLFDYYQSQNHRTSSANDLARFVTPDCLSPIADSLRSIYSDDEDFANGVLMLVHQIPYEASKPQEYPIETLVHDKGDCDLLSFIAASIMKAGGLDVTLLFYESVSHMNVGINLANEPHDARSNIVYFKYNGKRYYMAETTGGNWESGWRVGECPNNVKGISARIISLESSEQSSPERVTTSLNSLGTSSKISLALSSSICILGKNISISGYVLPFYSNVYITIYISSDNGIWSALDMVKTDSQGQYFYQWTPTAAGTFLFKANWSGDAYHAGATSQVQMLTVAPLGDVAIVEVLDASGNALTDAKVVINYSNETIYTDGKGRIYVNKVSYDEYSISVYWKGVNVSNATFDLTSGETQIISCSVYTLTVMVKNVLGISALGAKIRIHGENETAGTFLTEMTNIDGTLRVLQLPKGNYHINVLCAGSSDSRTILLNKSTNEIFSGIWDYTWYIAIASVSTLIVAITLFFMNRKE